MQDRPREPLIPLEQSCAYLREQQRKAKLKPQPTGKSFLEDWIRRHTRNSDA